MKILWNVFQLDFIQANVIKNVVCNLNISAILFSGQLS